MTNHNEYAYPTQGNAASGELEGGLTKREYFAAVAMQGICAGSGGAGKYTVNGGWYRPDTIANAAVEIADALIEALNKTPQQ